MEFREIARRQEFSAPPEGKGTGVESDRALAVKCAVHCLPVSFLHGPWASALPVQCPCTSVGNECTVWWRCGTSLFAMNKVQNEVSTHNTAVMVKDTVDTAINNQALILLSPIQTCVLRLTQTGQNTGVPYLLIPQYPVFTCACGGNNVMICDNDQMQFLFLMQSLQLTLALSFYTFSNDSVAFV